MRLLLFGATGMVGQGVLRECLRASDVSSVVTVGRAATGRRDSKLREIVLKDMFDYASIEADLPGFDACFFCLGVSSAGMNEADYTRLTYDLTLAAATVLARLNPEMTFVYVSGTGTDSSERGRVMWARVKGRTENALRRLPFKAVYLFRPGVIQPKHGVRSKTPWVRIGYVLLAPLVPIVRAIAPAFVTDTEKVGLAMLNVVRRGWHSPILENRDISEAAES